MSFESKIFETARTQIKWAKDEVEIRRSATAAQNESSTKKLNEALAVLEETSAILGEVSEATSADLSADVPPLFPDVDLPPRPPGAALFEEEFVTSYVGPRGGLEFQLDVSRVPNPEDPAVKEKLTFVGKTLGIVPGDDDDAEQLLPVNRRTAPAFGGPDFTRWPRDFSFTLARDVQWRIEEGTNTERVQMLALLSQIFGGNAANAASVERLLVRDADTREAYVDVATLRARISAAYEEANRIRMNAAAKAPLVVARGASSRTKFSRG